MSFSYSVAIRTLGTAGEKYKKLLNSIKKQKIQPEKVIVVLPKGYTPPTDRIGTEQFVFCEKGMIQQRIACLPYISSKYTLFCDDDVEFPEEFTEKLLDKLETEEYCVAAGPLLDFFPPKTFKYLVASLLGGACVMLRARDKYYVRLLKTGGFSYNDSIKRDSHRTYKTESLAGTCFMADTEVMRRMNYEEELWAEKTGYSAFEDRIEIGKMIVNGYNACIVSDASYIHNDGSPLRTPGPGPAPWFHLVPPCLPQTPTEAPGICWPAADRSGICPFPRSGRRPHPPAAFG